MAADFVVVRNAKGLKKTVSFRPGALFEEVFHVASREFGLNHRTHELRIGSDKVNLNGTVGGPNIPKTVILDIAPKLEGAEDETEVLVELRLLDEGHQLNECSKLMNSKLTLWNVVVELVPEWMRFSNDNVSLTYLGTTFTGKQMLMSVALRELCGNELRLSFTCSRNHPLISKRHDLCSIPEQQLDIPPSSSADSIETTTEFPPSLETLRTSVVELQERKGRLYQQINEIVSISNSEEFHNPDPNVVLTLVHFPNRLVLEGTFRATETIQDVMEFINGYLLDDAKNYYLYTIRPKLIADPLKPLRDMRSSPPGHLWYGGQKRDDLFLNKVVNSLVTRILSYTSSEESEREAIDKICCQRGGSEGYFWFPNLMNNN